jgi:CheY-like chemotaxis protein
MEQVLMNLVVNARDAMSEGGRLDIETVEMDLELEHARRLGLEEAGCCAVLVVRDTGTGMDQEVQKRIFEPFFTTKGPDKGTGLGLATVYGIVKQYRGGIQVRSQRGKGTGFEIYLPQVAVSGEAGGQERRSGAMLRGTETLLLAEDEVAVRRVLAFSLRELGYTVLEAGDGEKAIQVCEEYQGRIELLLTDMVMPKINGSVVAERISALRPGIKVLYMSGYADRTGRRASDLESVGSFIQKPFSVEVLARQVREMLNARAGACLVLELPARPDAAESLSTEEEQDAG